MGGYARPPATLLRDGISEMDSFVKVGLIQRGQIDYEDVGDITEVQAKSKPVNGCPPQNSEMTEWECSSPWYPQFIKVNTNKATSGIGNGIYYIHPMEGLHTGIVKSTNDPPEKSEDMFIVAKPGAIPDDVTCMKMD